MLEFRHSSIFSRLRGLLDVTRLVRSESDLPTVLDAIAATISESLGFGTVVVNLYRPAWDALQVTAVHGNGAAREALLGETRDREVWEALLAPAFERRGAYLIPAGEFDWNAGEVASFVPEGEPSDDPDAWDPEDALLVPLRHADGHLLGVLSVDEPVSGRKPSPDELDVLVAVADHAALAVQAAQEAADAARHRAALERLVDLSTRLQSCRSRSEILLAVCDAVRDALGFDVVGAELLDPESGRFLTAARVGPDSGAAGFEPPLSRAEVAALLDPELEHEGCFLLSGEQARERLGGDRPAPVPAAHAGRGPHAWVDHRLQAPLHDRAGAVVGFLWADEPRDRLLPGRERLQELRAFANQAATALESAAQFAALAAANERRQALIESSPLGILELDTDGVVRSCNPAAERMFGWSADEAIGRPPLWIPEQERDAIRRGIATVLAGGIYRTAEVARVRKDGRAIDVRISAGPLTAPDGSVVGVMSVLEDVSERRRAERALVASEARTAAVLAAALDAVITLDHEGRVLEFNPSAEETFGWTSGEVLGRDFLALALPPRLRGGFAQAIRTGGGPLLGTRLEIDAVRSDGREFPAELVVSRVDVEGPPLYTACLRDITRRKRQEEQLRETAAKYRTLVERLPLATYVGELGLPSRLTWVSPQVESMLGYLADEWLGEGFFERHLHPDDRERVLAAADGTRTTGQIFREEYRLIAKDGRVVWVLDETVAVRDEEYRPLFLQGFLIDITDRKESEEALRRNELVHRLVVENTSDSVALLAPDGTIVYSSPASTRLLGWTPEELTGRPFVEFVHPDDVAASTQRLRTSLESAEQQPAYARIRHRDGRFVEFEGVSIGLQDETGAVGMLVIARPAGQSGQAALRLVG